VSVPPGTKNYFFPGCPPLEISGGQPQQAPDFAAAVKAAGAADSDQQVAAALAALHDLQQGNFTLLQDREGFFIFTQYGRIGGQIHGQFSPVIG